METCDHLKGLMDERDRFYVAQLASQKELFTTISTSAKEAVSIANLANKEHLKVLNEFRQTWDDREKNYPQKPEVNVRFDSLNARIDSTNESIVALSKSVGSGEGRSAAIVSTWTIIIAVAALVIGYISGHLGARDPAPVYMQSSPAAK